MPALPSSEEPGKTDEPERFSRILDTLITEPGVIGALIVGLDGTLVADKLPPEYDRETIGIMSLGVYINTVNSAKKLGQNHLHQMVCQTKMGCLVIANLGDVLLITVSDSQTRGLAQTANESSVQ